MATSARGRGTTVGLFGLAGLLLLTGAFGRSFSKLELGVPWLHVTEIVLVAVLATAALQTQPREWVLRLRQTGALVPIAVFWIVGGIATARGLLDWGFTEVLHDVGLLEYSILVALLAVLITDKRQFLGICRVVALAGFLAIVALAVSSLTPVAWDLASRLGLVAAASGMYATLFVAWVLARRAAGMSVTTRQYASVALAAGLIVVGSSRSGWLAVIVAVGCIAALALPRQRLSLVAQMAALLILGTVAATAAQQARTLQIPAPSAVATSLVAEAEGIDPPELDLAVRVQGMPPEAHTGDDPVLNQVPDGAATEKPHGGYQPDSLFANPGIERGDIHGYTSFAPNQLTASSERAKSGAYSLQATYGGDPRLAKTLTYLPLDSTTRYRISAWIYLPADWSGGAVGVSTDRTWEGASENTAESATTKTGLWTMVHAEISPEERDLVGGVHIRTASPASPGSIVYIDDVRIDPVREQAVTAAETAAAAATPPAAPAAKPEANGLAELTASFRSSSQRANAEWRLAFWKFILDQTAKRPLSGVGFGAPSNFEWSGIRYDSRSGEAADPFDVSGPHNSFFNVLFRTGLPGFIALLAIVVIALLRTVRVARWTSGADKAIAVWLVASIAAGTVTASLSVALEGPFMGIFFWTIIGLALIAPRFLAPTPGDGQPAG